MFVLVNENPEIGACDYGMAMLDHLGMFEELKDALENRDKARKDWDNPNIHVYQLVWVREELDADEDWHEEDEEGPETPMENPKAYEPITPVKTRDDEVANT